MHEVTVSLDDAKALLSREESHFLDFKSKDSTGKVIQKIASALANADGGEFIVGIEDSKRASDLARWQGFESIEDGNHVLASLTRDIKPPVPYSVEWVRCPEINESFVCVVTIRKSADVHETADASVYVRRSASTARIDGQDRVNLALSKGAETYENQELASYETGELVEEKELDQFLQGVSPRTDADDFVRKQRLVNTATGKVRLCGAILFADSPSAVSAKRCAVKVARYGTKAKTPERKHLAGVPATIEGPARLLIDQTIDTVQQMIEAVSVLDSSGNMTQLHYPPEALKEVIVNAVIHRDYNISDDIVIRVFDNRVEVRSPGRLPGHMTLNNLLTDRFSRNPTINRLINKYPDPPNKDIGEGLKTLMRSMADAKLKPPTFDLEDNYFVVTIEHTPLARPEELVLDYLASNPEITNAIARELTGINSENTMKEVFYTLRDAQKIERVPGKAGNKSAWRLIPVSTPRPRGQRAQPRRQTRARRRSGQRP